MPLIENIMLFVFKTIYCIYVEGCQHDAFHSLLFASFTTRLQSLSTMHAPLEHLAAFREQQCELLTMDIITGLEKRGILFALLHPDSINMSGRYYVTKQFQGKIVP